MLRDSARTDILEKLVPVVSVCTNRMVMTTLDVSSPSLVLLSSLSGLGQSFYFNCDDCYSCFMYGSSMHNRDLKTALCWEQLPVINYTVHGLIVIFIPVNSKQ